MTPAVTKAAAGAIEYLPIASVAGIPAMLDRASRKGVWSVGLDEGGSQSLFDLNLTDQPIVLVLGAEGRGLARLTRDRCDVLAHIPMRGRVASLNVAPPPPPHVTRSRVASDVASGVLAGLAQLAEQLICNQQVVGSNPTPGSRHTSPRNRKCLYCERAEANIVR